jgi:hypothetical protein
MRTSDGVFVLSVSLSVSLVCLVVVTVMVMSKVNVRGNASGNGIALVCQTASSRERFSSYLNKRSSCFSCERSIPRHQDRWMAQPSRCFSCEREMVGTGGDPFSASKSSVVNGFGGRAL